MRLIGFFLQGFYRYWWYEMHDTKRFWDLMHIFMRQGCQVHLLSTKVVIRWSGVTPTIYYCQSPCDCRDIMNKKMLTQLSNGSKTTSLLFIFSESFKFEKLEKPVQILIETVSISFFSIHDNFGWNSSYHSKWKKKLGFKMMQRDQTFEVILNLAWVSKLRVLWYC